MEFAAWVPLREAPAPAPAPPTAPSGPIPGPPLPVALATVPAVKGLERPTAFDRSRFADAADEHDDDPGSPVQDLYMLLLCLAAVYLGLCILEKLMTLGRRVTGGSGI